MPCKNVPICSEQYTYPFNYCKICQEEIEDAAIKSALNMGVPDWFQCGECGERYDTTALFLEHPCVREYAESKVRNILVHGDESDS